MLTITESAGGYLRAGLTGLGGVFTGGPIGELGKARKRESWE